MTHPGAEIQTAIYSALIASSELTNLLGGDRVYDDVPPNAKPPYITFGKSLHDDWSTDTEGGMEHEIDLHIWSRKNGRKEVFELQEIIIAALSALGGPLGEHHLVNFNHEQSEIEMRDKHRAFRGISRFRAISEPII